RESAVSLPAGEHEKENIPPPVHHSTAAYDKTPTEAATSDGHGTPASAPAIPDAPPVPRFTRDKLDALKQDADFSQLLFLTETYLGKTLNSTEINALCYYYDTLKFPAELIEYLVESCVSKGHKSFHYIEAVAQRWHSAGIRTVQEAKQQSSQYTKQYYSVLRAFGITDRSPIEQEIHMIDHWTNDFGFSTDLICEACSRTIQAINKASFSYADSILANWQKQKVHSRKDLEVIDARHTGAKPPRANSNEKKSQANNRFNNFSQREYDYRELEQKLLKKQ
ncbi:MAG TPA: DNA replication protein DnaD, partial [Lachnospiraceae bacterium]|nr:DNA replication protein DnaD [Lachnospiraceae bacterium]